MGFSNLYMSCFIFFVTLRVSRRRRVMYCGHARLYVCLCVCLSVRCRTPTLLHGPGCNLGVVGVHYWAFLQSALWQQREREMLASTCLYLLYA